MTANETTVAKYLLQRLKQLGCDDMFGVPGDFVLAFFDEVVASDIKYIGTCNELNAAYAADGYARIKGIGAVSVTYNVGELSAINGIAGSFAEKVPVVFIGGCPSLAAYENQSLLHHTLGDYGISKKMFEMVTCASTLITSIENAGTEIDRVLTACIREQQPVYIGIPSDVVNKVIPSPKNKIEVKPIKTDAGALAEAVEEALQMLNKSKKPIIVADVELLRYKLQKDFANLLDKSGIPYATVLLGKCVLDESHPQFIGLYQGAISRKYVKERIETSDCVLNLGAFLSDFNTGGFSTKLDPKKSIRASSSQVVISNHAYLQVPLKDFIQELAKKIEKKSGADLDIHPATQGCVHRRSAEYSPQKDNKVTLDRFFNRVSSFIPENAVVIAETGQSLFSAAETLLPNGSVFIGQIFYGSIGYTVGATLGVAVAAPDRQVVLFVGDGSFQVTCQDLSTMIRYNTSPVIFLLNNDGYLIERVITDNIYNDIQMWKYHLLPQLFGSKGESADVLTEGDLENALQLAEKQKNKYLTFIEIHTDKMDASENLKSAGKGMANANFIKK
jgi:indolepyruvate decarboxylase